MVSRKKNNPVGIYLFKVNKETPEQWEKSVQN